MTDTVLHGTARKHFRNFFRGNLSDVRVGGKRAPLRTNPKGMYDWFVGYAQRGDRKWPCGTFYQPGKVACKIGPLWHVKP
ncbi:MAG: hypothetical protein CM1200mP20_16890 [Pseudomonadota bacterium]|nr:MAG: hypothetical protein CM1200mP20_16890 [Pseudomonadota bacterium]